MYAINPETTEDPFLFPATGLRVDSVAHDRLCMSQASALYSTPYILYPRPYTLHDKPQSTLRLKSYTLNH